MMSPSPESPETVVGFAPIRSASQRISAQPWTTSAAWALCPRSIPSTMPAAMASTFLRAPQISTPTTSSEVLIRSVSEAISSCTRAARHGSSEAATSPVGRCSMISRAKDGPERKQVGCCLPSTLAMMSDIVSPVRSSSPLETQMMGRLGGTSGLIRRRNARECWQGTASRANCAPRIASAASTVALTLSGRRNSLRYRVLTRFSLMSAQTFSSRMRRTTSIVNFLRARTLASAVPKLPPPKTTILRVLDSTSSLSPPLPRSKRDQRMSDCQASWMLLRSESG
mmetsp:Transcript_10976/g.26054  ORF Transcript_10976/g.26054 Transcript_10976/m.26054 type:complete len:283 (+) Transcript_10976:327-1175(+)